MVHDTKKPPQNGGSNRSSRAWRRLRSANLQRTNSTDDSHRRATGTIGNRIQRHPNSSLTRTVKIDGKALYHAIIACCDCQRDIHVSAMVLDRVQRSFGETLPRVGLLTCGRAPTFSQVWAVLRS
jgi:hypothetical protein